jgi:integrase/recombinase XerD
MNMSYFWDIISSQNLIIMTDFSKDKAEYRAYLTLSNFKSSTIKAYGRTLEHFLAFYNTSHGHQALGQDIVQIYLLMRLDQGKSWSTINADYSALRKFFKIIKDYEWSLKKLPRPKRDKRLPDILSKEEVAKLISAAPTLKYQTFLTFLYSTGCRLSEACQVKIDNIDADRMQIRFDMAKGGKDRVVCMPMPLLVLLRKYYKVYRPKIYLFNGRRRGDVYSASAGQWAVRRARLLAGITKKCAIHTLRNC